MRKLVLFFILLAVPVIVLAQTHTFCAQDLPCATTANNTHSGTETFAQLSGCQHVNTLQTMTAALAAASSGCVSIDPGTYTISTSLAMTSNLDIECSPNNQTILIANASLNAPLLTFTSVNHSRMAGCVLDSNRSGNANNVDMIQMTGSSFIEISGNHLQNGNQNGIFLVSGNDQIKILNNEIDHEGKQGSGCGIGSIPNSGTANTNVTVLGNRMHDGNQGMCIFPSSTVTNITRGWDVGDNFFYLNFNDGFSLFSAAVGTNGLVQGGKLHGNESYCNGWPANGTNRSANCPAPGMLQSGVTQSSSGSGFDFNSAVMEGWTVSNNQAHDNYFEGFDFTPQVVGNVSCTNVANSVCTWQSGDQFNVAWKPNQGINIAGTQYVISVVTSATSLTLTTNSGVLSNVLYVGTGYARMTIYGNVADHNGFGQPTSSSGQGFSNIGYGDTFFGNIAKNNWSYGMIDQISTLVSHVGDKAFNNCRGGGGCGVGILDQTGYREQFIDIATDDSIATNLQSTSVFLANNSNSYVRSNALCNYSSCGLATGGDSNASGNNIWDSGRDRGVGGITSQLYFNSGGGQGAIDYVGGGGAFTSKIPALNGTIADTVENVSLRQQQIISDQGVACTNIELVLSAGWGTTATVTGVVGTGQTCEWTITSSGTGQTANPTITDTLTNALPSASTVCDMRMVGGTGAATLIDQTTLSATAPIFTLQGTPTAALTYKVVRKVGP